VLKTWSRGRFCSWLIEGEAVVVAITIEEIDSSNRTSNFSQNSTRCKVILTHPKLLMVSCLVLCLHLGLEVLFLLTLSNLLVCNQTSG
jgi:hypothetical protein